MSTELNGTVGRVSAGYSLKVPHEVQYASQEAHASLSLEVDVSAIESYEEAEKVLEDIEARMFATVKLIVGTQLGIDFDADGNGVFTPNLKAPARTEAAPKRRSSSGGGGGGRGRGGGTAPKADAGRIASLPRVTLGGVVYIDQRPLKEDGTYASGAADFKSVEKFDGRNYQLWLYDKSGAVNDETADLLDEAGIDY